MTDGVLRPVVRRTSMPSRLKIGSGASGSVVSSTGSPAVMPVKVEGRTPCEPATLAVSESTADFASSGFASLWNGKSSAVSCALGPLVVNGPIRGLSWLRERLSAPALKWHVAHAVRPSLPACMSQNSALPSLTALVLSRMYVVSSGGEGTGELSSDARIGVLRAPAEPVPAGRHPHREPRAASASAIACTGLVVWMVGQRAARLLLTPDGAPASTRQVMINSS